MNIWSSSILGQSILKGKHPKSIDDFRSMVPLTSYDDYADLLLQRRAEDLPDNPVIWIQTTWEGGKHPIKIAPYTRSMLDTFRTNVAACLILATTTEKGKINVDENDKLLYGLAPLPYATGLLPHALNEEIDIKFLPPVKSAEGMTFSERNKLGFKLAMQQDVELFFGLGSVAYAISQSLSNMSSGSSSGLSSLLKCKPKMIHRILKAKRLCKKEKRPLKPKDLFRLKGFMVAGTDNRCYKDDLEALWGIRPMEIFAGTEPSLIGTETWTRDGMYFFPDACFYEFISEKDMHRTFEDPDFVPKTYIPRFEYVDRIPQIIDIAGFTRISQYGIQNAIDLSGLGVTHWTACKAFNENCRPYMHLYVEVEDEGLTHRAVNTEIIKEILTTYFKYIDQDYRDLKKILGMDPLVVSILKCGTFATYKSKHGKEIAKMNPTHFELDDLIKSQESMRFERR